MSAPRVAIIGAGLAGLACARTLADAGLHPVLFDKSRGLGGRLATRRAEGGLQFDHGAPSVTATDPGFAAWLREGEAAGSAMPWSEPLGVRYQGLTAYIGRPGMSGIVRPLARGLDIRSGIAVRAVSHARGSWQIAAGEAVETFDRVILTLPAPQIAALLGPDEPLTAALSTVRMSPCLTLMAAFSGPAPEGGLPPGAWPDALDWVSLDSTKPGRVGEPAAWVAQANAAFSRRHLELDMPAIAALLLPILSAALGRDPADAIHAQGHRWRYARTERPLGQPCLADPSRGLFLGGDWCLGPLAQDAWLSGRAIASDILR